MNVIVDTSIWIDFFRGGLFPKMETALKEGRVYLTPLIASELISGVRTKREEKELQDLIQTLPLVETPLSHWINVGHLRNKCRKKGLNISTPDAHIAQSTLDIAGILYASDSIFLKIPESIKLKHKIFPKKAKIIPPVLPKTPLPDTGLRFPAGTAQRLIDEDRNDS